MLGYYIFRKKNENNDELNFSGSFQVGETVKGVSLASGVGDVQIPGMSPQITFRAAQANHKKGTYNAPSKTFTDNPYNNKPLSSAYSSTSTI